MLFERLLVHLDILYTIIHGHHARDLFEFTEKFTQQYGRLCGGVQISFALFIIVNDPICRM